jgi:branched-chain amino acid transport system substrate-binding protein
MRTYPTDPRTRRKEGPGVRADFPWFSRHSVRMSVVAALGVSVLAACTSTSTSTGSASLAGTSTGPIIIGASLSLTGNFSDDGVAYDRGYHLWSS